MFVKMLKTTGRIAIVLALLLVSLIAALWVRAYKPSDIETVDVSCAPDAPVFVADRPLKVLSYNVQYMASKNYIFFYDIDLNNEERVAEVEKAGKTIADRPSLQDIRWTIEEVARIIEAEQPDVVLLQEVNTGDDSRTHYVDQISALMDRLGKQNFPCFAHTPYWKAEYIFHPSILGPVDMRLLTLSRHRIESATRHQLPRPDINALERPFYFQRAVLETRHPMSDGRTSSLLNTHFEAWGAGTGVMQRQVAYTYQLLRSLDAENTPWILGGDLNLLPPDGQRQRAQILRAETGVYDEEPAIRPLYDAYGAIPALSDLVGENAVDWYTHIPNDPTVSAPDRTIDYVFYSPHWTPDATKVVHGTSWTVSDHLPVVGSFVLSE